MTTPTTLERIDLDEFIAGYVEAMIWTEECQGVDRTEFETAEFQARMVEGMESGQLPAYLDESDLSDDARAIVKADCEAFIAKAGAMLAEAVARPGYNAGRAGHDFWLTRNGHGTGFWDRSELEPDSDAWAATRIPLNRWTPEMSKAHAEMKAASLGQRLSDACRHQEVHVWWNAETGQIEIG